MLRTAMAGSDTPMMRQYRSIKSTLSEDTVLFFRLGDFYEMFFEDAKTTAEVLDITLTKRNKMPMCGIPYHQLEPYLAKMMRAGYKVAICEQVEDPADAKGIVRREVTRVVTPGTLIEEHVLEAARNNYLVGIAHAGSTYGMALLDLSTGEFWIEESERADWLSDALLQYAPAECIVPEEQAETVLRPLLTDRHAGLVSRQEDWIFEPDVAVDTLTRHFRVQSLEGFGCQDCAAGLQAAGGVLYYVTRTLHRDAAHIRRLRVRNPAEYLLLDETTIANLDLLPRRRPGRAAADPNLLQVLDATRTAMGARLLRAWLLRPLRALDGISARHDAVETLAGDRAALARLRDLLGGVKDLERLATRLGGGGANARDARALGHSLDQIAPLGGALAAFEAPMLRDLCASMRPLPELTARILTSIEDEPPVTVREGGLIRRGVHPELDALREAATEGRRWLAEFQAAEQERTGIKSLKVRHNKVFGYYIEITKSNLAHAPEQYVRKQTLVNAERFITPELKEYENRILGAQDRAKDLEYELFQELRRAIAEETPAIQQIAAAVAALDVLGALADRALALRYVRPSMSDGGAIRITDGRHPIIEQMPDADRFVPNDTLLDRMENQVLIITGPNMAGKSTYIRQVALITILAQMGSFVPAARAEMGVVDRVFSRVGASDDLARGRSTFMVEMQETANILNNATPQSLVVLDEIGRGTSTFDGISIAWAVAEHLHNHPGVKAKTLFATHYHELTDLALTLPGVKNYSVMVRESGDKVVFLRRIAPGAADKSYGIQVARLAGLPTPVIERANEILANLEEGEFAENRQPALARHRPRKGRDHPDQLALF
jgi:DNA mismatch repair protein MutS